MNAAPSMKKARIMNTKAVKTFALGCSAKHRAGKFTRVGQEFLNEVEADIESMVRGMERPGIDGDLSGVVFLNFVSGELMKKMERAVNVAVAKMILSKVKRHPTVGKTLGRTT